MRVKCLALQKHNGVPWPGLELGPLGSESRALTIRPLRFSLLSEEGSGEGGGGKEAKIFQVLIFSPLRGRKGSSSRSSGKSINELACEH